MRSEATTEEAPSFSPTSSTERISAIDVVRGFALLGILLMNIVDMGFPSAAYSNLNLHGGNSGPNLWAYVLQYVFAEGKMRALFSMMFGAGIVLFTARGDSIRVADLYFRRILWLWAFGIVHAFVIWRGDILYPYAVCGLFLFAFRDLAPKRLFAIAGVCVGLLLVLDIGAGFEQIESKKKYDEAIALEKKGTKLNDDRKKAKEAWEEKLKDRSPEEARKEIAAYRGPVQKVFAQRAKDVWRWHSLPTYFPGLADFYAMMLAGMALLKTGVLAGTRSTGFYAKLAAAGYAIGLPLNSVTVWLQIRSNFDMMQEPFIFSTYQVGRISVALAHMSVLMILCREGWLSWVTARLAAVGRMAFSNYIAHSLIGGFLFYGGYGFGLFGALERHQLYFAVAGMWAFSLIWSPLWLARFRFGPLEWCWRSLTYWRRQPMRLEERAPLTSGSETLRYTEADSKPIEHRSTGAHVP